MSTTTLVIKNTGFLYIKMAVTVFISLYTTRLILSSLGASDFGIFNIIGGAIVMLGFLNATMANATQRFMSYAEGEGNLIKKRQIFNVSMVLHVAVAVFTCILLLLVMRLLFNDVFNIPVHRIFAAKVIYLSTIASTVLTIINVPYDSVVNAHENMLYYSLIGIFECLLRLAIAFVCVYTNSDKLIVYGVLTAMIPLITLTIMKIYCHRKYDECVFSIRKYWDSNLLKRITSFFSWNFLTAISSLVSYYGSGLVLNHFFGTILSAAQGIANQVNGQLSNFSLNLMKAVNPVIVKRAGSHDMEAMNRVTLTSGKFSTLLIVLFAVPFILEMHYVLRIWLKDVPEWTAMFCCMQLIVTVICQLASSVATAVYAEGNIKRYTIYKSIMNVLPVYFTYLAYTLGGAPYWLYIFMIAIWSVGGDMVIIYYSNKQCGLKISDFLIQVVCPVLCISVCMFIGGFAIKSLFEESFLRLILVCCMTSIVFGICVWNYALKKEERISVLQLINGRLKRNK